MHALQERSIALLSQGVFLFLVHGHVTAGRISSIASDMHAHEMRLSRWEGWLVVHTMTDSRAVRNVTLSACKLMSQC